MRNRLSPFLMLSFFLVYPGFEVRAQVRPLTRQLTPLSRLSASFQYLARKVSPAVVQIVTRGYEPVKGEDSGTVATARGTGSGIILDPDGYIVTNGHVVEGAQRVLGDTVDLEILRGSEKIAAKVAVAERPNDPNRFADLVTRQSNLIPQLGILVLNLNEQLASMLPPLRKPAGVLVAARVAEAPGLGEDFATGDLISAINGEAILNLDGLRSALDQVHSGDPVVAQVQRQGRLTFVVFEMP